MGHPSHILLSLILAAALVVFCMCCAPVQTTAQGLDPIPLDALVPQVSSTLLTNRMQQNDRILVFDVREREEFAVSRLPGAMHVSPATSPDQFLSRVANRVRGATFVFYCAVGARSADLAQGVYHDLMARGAVGVFVLQGGIIDWHNQGHVLVDAKGPSKFVHPFNDELKSRLKSPALARSIPREGY